MLRLSPTRICVASATLCLIESCTAVRRTPPTQAPQSVRAAPSPGAQSIGGVVLDPEELLIDAQAQPVVGEAPLTVYLTATLSDEATQPAYSWDFGDGDPPAHEPTVFHRYEQPGVYMATVTVTDATGKTGTDDVEIVVSAQGK